MDSKRCKVSISRDAGRICPEIRAKFFSFYSIIPFFEKAEHQNHADVMLFF